MLRKSFLENLVLEKEETVWKQTEGCTYLEISAFPFGSFPSKSFLAP